MLIWLKSENGDLSLPQKKCEMYFKFLATCYLFFASDFS